MNARIGVYICHCGGNISDYVDVERVREAIEREEGVVVAKTTMFVCSEAAQKEIIEDVKEKGINRLVIASCSSKLHLYTFRGLAERAGLNPYQYVQVNIREQDSWAHTDDPEGATEKAIRLVRSGIRKARKSKPLHPIRLDTVRKVLIIGGGIAGLRAAITLAYMGIYVFLVEKEKSLGGWIGKFSSLYPHDRNGKEIVTELLREAKEKEEITIFTEAELVEKSGTVGDFNVKIRAKDEVIPLNVGAIIVATGFEAYSPSEGEFGYGTDGVVTLPEFKQMVENSNGKLEFAGKKIRTITYIYCVGSRQQEGNTYCSRYCCTSTVHTAILTHKIDPSIRQFHLFRDIRTYGKYELLYEEAGKKGSVFIKYDETEPPVVEKSNGRLRVRVKDILTQREELELETDLVVLVTGMEPRKNNKLVDILKLPIGRDGFFNEIHPKLRPVETLVDGVYIAGAAQAPKNASETTASALAAAAKAAGLVMKGYVELEPQVAIVNEETCEWCGKCLEACPYEAIEKRKHGEKEVAFVFEALCKGCGACVAACPVDAIDIEGYTDLQIKEMIDALLKEAER